MKHDLIGTLSFDLKSGCLLYMAIELFAHLSWGACYTRVHIIFAKSWYLKFFLYYIEIIVSIPDPILLIVEERLVEELTTNTESQ